MKWRSLFPPVLGGLVGVAAALCFAAGVFGNSSARLSDRLFSPRSVDPRIVIITIDDTSLERIGRWPWARSVHATLIQRLKAAGVAAIGYDVNFPEVSTTSDDRALAQAIRAAGNVVLPLELPLERSTQALLYDPQRVVRPIPALLSGARASGHSNTPLDTDGVVRKIPLQVSAQDGSVVPAFAYAVGTVAGVVPSPQEIPLERFGYTRVYFSNAPRQAFATISAADVIQGTKDVRALQGAIVFVGATAHDLHDEFYVPTSGTLPMSGVEIHASFLDTLMQRAWLHPIDRGWQMLFLFLLGLVLGLLIPRVRLWIGLPLVAVLWSVWMLGAFSLFDRGYVTDLVWPTLVFLFATLVLSIERWVTNEKNKQELRLLFGRYVSPVVLDALLRDPEKVTLGGEKRVMTVLFSDLRGFTTMSEGMTPEELISVLNIYLTAMTDIVFEQKGVLDKYIGDAVMAFWNAPLDESRHAQLAAKTALLMRSKLKAMNQALAFGANRVLAVGIGLNTGEMVVGNVGSLTRHDYTVIGDNVNLASRVEGLNKEYGTEILVTESVAAHISEQFLLRKVDQVAVKGKKEGVNLYELVDDIQHVTSEDRHKVERFEEMLRLYFAGSFQRALVLADALLEQYPEDGPTKLLVARIAYFLQHPPEKGWNGTWVMNKK